MSVHNRITFVGNIVCYFIHQIACDGCPARRVFNFNSRSELHPVYQAESRIDNKETEKNFIFAGLFYFLVLVPQTLREMFGEQLEYDFYRCTGWPLVSAGLGGYLPPKRMLEEASLFPCEAERDNFHRMLTEVLPFMNAELRHFFMQKDREINDVDAYSTMISKMGDNVEAFLKKIEAESTIFTASFQYTASQA